MIERTLVISIKQPVNLGIGDRIRHQVDTDVNRLCLFFLFHFLLGRLIIDIPMMATLQLGATILIGLWWGAIRPNMERLALVASYLVGSEVLWRLTKAGPFWEFGKYSLIFLLGLGLVRSGRLRAPVFALAFFGCLLPSIVMPLANIDSALLRDDLSFYLSGPLSLTISTWFFSYLRLKTDDLQRLYYAMLGPAITLASIAFFSIISLDRLRFSNNSNLAASGGFGPNQVSAALGLAIVFAFLALQNRKITPLIRGALVVILLFLTAQCALTFSRSGIYLAAGGIITASLFMLRERRFLTQLLIGIGALALAVNFLVLPRLEKMTGGLLSNRFANTKLTGRDRLVMADWRAFSENPVFGLGPGQARVYRDQIFSHSAAHTEFSRLLAEHGLFGIVAILLLLGMGLRHFRQKRTVPGKALAASMISWSFLFMLVSAMRLAAPGFAFGLAAIAVNEE